MRYRLFVVLTLSLVLAIPSIALGQGHVETLRKTEVSHETLQFASPSVAESLRLPEPPKEGIRRGVEFVKGLSFKTITFAPAGPLKKSSKPEAK